MIQLPAVPFLTKVIAVLSLLLVLSFGLNTWQLYHAGKVSGKAENQKELDILQAKNLGLEKTAAVNSAIANLAKEETVTLIEDMKTIASTAQKTKTVYRGVASRAPLPINCAPGALRVEKVNEGLGAQQ